MPKTLRFFVDPSGGVQAVHSDEGQRILEEMGPLGIERASNVEPQQCLSDTGDATIWGWGVWLVRDWTSLGWWATRQAALEAEVVEVERRLGASCGNGV